MKPVDFLPLLKCIQGEPTFGRDIDSKIREAANHLTARAIFELCARFDISTADGLNEFVEVAVASGRELTGFIGFDDGTMEFNETEEIPEFPETPVVFHLRLNFANEDAAYYQFHLFPSMSEPFLMGGARKRSGASQVVRVEVPHEKYLQVFIEGLRSNPHFVSVDDITEEEFISTPSNGV